MLRCAPYDNSKSGHATPSAMSECGRGTGMKPWLYLCWKASCCSRPHPPSPTPMHPPSPTPIHPPAPTPIHPPSPTPIHPPSPTPIPPAPPLEQALLLQQQLREAGSASSCADAAYQAACQLCDSCEGDDLPGLLSNWGQGLLTLAGLAQVRVWAGRLVWAKGQGLGSGRGLRGEGLGRGHGPRGWWSMHRLGHGLREMARAWAGARGER